MAPGTASYFSPESDVVTFFENSRKSVKSYPPAFSLKTLHKCMLQMNRDETTETSRKRAKLTDSPVASKETSSAPELPPLIVDDPEKRVAGMQEPLVPASLFHQAGESFFLSRESVAVLPRKRLEGAVDYCTEFSDIPAWASKVEQSLRVCYAGVSLDQLRSPTPRLMRVPRHTAGVLPPRRIAFDADGTFLACVDNDFAEYVDALLALEEMPDKMCHYKGPIGIGKSYLAYWGSGFLRYNYSLERAKERQAVQGQSSPLIAVIHVFDAGGETKELLSQLFMEIAVGYYFVLEKDSYDEQSFLFSSFLTDIQKIYDGFLQAHLNKEQFAYMRCMLAVRSLLLHYYKTKGIIPFFVIDNYNHLLRLVFEEGAQVPGEAKQLNQALVELSIKLPCASILFISSMNNSPFTQDNSTIDNFQYQKQLFFKKEHVYLLAISHFIPMILSDSSGTSPSNAASADASSPAKHPGPKLVEEKLRKLLCMPNSTDSIEVSLLDFFSESFLRRLVFATNFLPFNLKLVFRGKLSDRDKEERFDAFIAKELDMFIYKARESFNASIDKFVIEAMARRVPADTAVLPYYNLMFDLQPFHDHSGCDLRYFYNDSGQWKPLTLLLGTFLLSYLNRHLNVSLVKELANLASAYGSTGSEFGAVWERLLKACLLNIGSMNISLPLFHSDSFKVVPRCSTDFFEGNVFKRPAEVVNNCFYWGLSQTLPLVEGFLVTETRFIGIQITTGSVAAKLKGILQYSSSKNKLWLSVKEFLQEGEALVGSKRVFSLLLLATPDALETFIRQHPEIYEKLRSCVVFADACLMNPIVKTIYEARVHYLAKRAQRSR